MGGCLGGVSIAKGTRFELRKDCRALENGHACICSRENLTAKTIDGPLLELLERDLQCWRHLVEIEAVRVVDRSVSGLSELFPLVIEDRPPLGIDPGCFLPDHDCANVDFALEIFNLEEHVFFRVWLRKHREGVVLEIA